MEVVAKHLYSHAVKNHQDNDAELFVRTAYNRYYYHVYLGILNEKNSLLGKEKARMSHKSDKILDEYKDKAKNLLKKKRFLKEMNLIDDLVKNLIEKLHCLYDIRLKADYSLSPKIMFTGGSFIIDIKPSSTGHQYSISCIESKVKEAMEIISTLNSYRQKAGSGD